MPGYVHRCPECRTRRKDHALFMEHLRKSQHKLCICGGYHFAHRKGSPYCYENPVSALYLADRQGEGAETLLQIADYIVADRPELFEAVNDVCIYLNVRKA